MELDKYKTLFNLWDINADKDKATGLENLYKLEEDLANDSIKYELN